MVNSKKATRLSSYIVTNTSRFNYFIHFSAWYTYFCLLFFVHIVPTKFHFDMTTRSRLKLSLSTETTMSRQFPRRHLLLLQGVLDWKKKIKWQNWRFWFPSRLFDWLENMCNLTESIWPFSPQISDLKASDRRSQTIYRLSARTNSNDETESWCGNPDDDQEPTRNCIVAVNTGMPRRK